MDQRDPPFLEADPPHWAARGLWYALIASAALALTAAVFVDVPDTVSGTFTLTAATQGGPDRVAHVTGEVLIPESGYALVDSGHAVQLRFDAFPYQRYGSRLGTVRSVGSVAGTGLEGALIRVMFDLAQASIDVRDRDRPLLAGMGGRAEIIVGRRSLGGFLFGSYTQR